MGVNIHDNVGKQHECTDGYIILAQVCCETRSKVMYMYMHVACGSVNER